MEVIKQSIAKTICNISHHVLFWIVFTFFFLNDNILRPFATEYCYKEIVVLVLIMAACYAGYFLIIPKYYLIGFFTKFRIYTLSLIAFISFVEIILLFPEMQQNRPKDVSAANFYYVRTVFGILIRNLSVILFFFLLRANKFYKNLLLISHKANLDNATIYHIVKSKSEVKTVNINEIVYVHHDKNYTYFHLSNGEVHSMYISLSKVEDSLPGDSFVRINRNTIVNMNYKISLADNVLTINFKERGSESNKCFSVSTLYQNCSENRERNV